MCGIAGIIAPTELNLSSIYKMMEVQKHRGPDGEGYLIQKGDQVIYNPGEQTSLTGSWVIAHKRLSIIDMTQNGLQPMSYMNGRYWVTFNGEIYNYKELKQELQDKGFEFRTHTDTEVILAAYAAWGYDCFSKFNGMWAMVIIDKSNDTFVMSRDRFGEKPLHYKFEGDALLFSSEIKGILSSLDNYTPEANRDLVLQFLHYSAVNHTNDTFFKGIFAFPPASYAIGHLKNPTGFKVFKYWDVDQIEENGSISFQEASRNFNELFISSVNLRMRSDVNVGFCLSGGLDSSSIVCAAAKSIDRGVLSTFTATSSVESLNEKAWADIINKAVNSKAYYSNINEQDFIENIDRLIWHQDEPFTTSSIFAQWSLMKLARENNIPVMLDGQGADEVLCGYRKFYFFYLKSLLRANRFLKFGQETINLVVNGDRGIWNISEGTKYLPSFLRIKFEKTTGMLKNGFEASSLQLHTSGSLLAHQKQDLKYFSLPSLLRYEDRNSMAWSVESRVPFLDHRLVELALSCPPSYKLANGQTKYIMRDAFKEFVPAVTLNRRDKMGFSTAQQTWMSNNLGRLIMKSIHSDDFLLKNFVNTQAVEEALSKGESSGLIFRIFMIDKWARAFNVKI